MTALTKTCQDCICLFTIIIFFSGLSCQREKELIPAAEKNDPHLQALPPASGLRKAPAKLHVNSLNDLYQVVNDPSNRGAQVLLAPGVYLLNAGYPNGGRLELQQDMSLLGEPGKANLVNIDASSLPGSSFVPAFNFPAARTGAIRMGRGSNSVEWITVTGNGSAQALSVIDTDLIQDTICEITVAHCVIIGGRIGLDIRNVGQASINRLIKATLSGNEIVNNLVQAGQGIEIQNANGASSARIEAALTNNYIHGNKIGLRSFNNNANNTATDNCSIVIHSNSDEFINNGIGIFLASSLNQGITTTASNNTLRFESHGATISDNRGELPPDLPTMHPGGIYLAASISANKGVGSNNTLQLQLSGCNIANNNGPDLNAYGFLSLTGELKGTRNTTLIELSGNSTKTIIETNNSVPVETVPTNLVTIIRK